MTKEESQGQEMIDVQILGETYTIKSETGSEYTQRVARHVDRMAKEIREESGIVDQKKVAILTALANDINYSSIFKEQLANLLDEGDVVIGISASGNSPNILEGIEFARNKGARTIGFAGFGGGRLKELAEKCIVLASMDYGQVEDAHMSLAHIISYLVKEKIANG